MDYMVAGALLAGIAVFAQKNLREDSLTGSAYAIDGDTIDIAGQHIRLQGIDAPELAQDCTRDGKLWPCGEAARDVVVRLVQRGTTVCTSSERDDYDRPLARCKVGETDVAEAVVKAGLAITYRGRQYQAAEEEARAAKRGIWAGTFEKPVDYRAAHPRDPRALR